MKSPRVGYIYSRDSCNGCLKRIKATQVMVSLDFGEGITLSVRLCLKCAKSVQNGLNKAIKNLEE